MDGQAPLGIVAALREVSAGHRPGGRPQRRREGVVDAVVCAHAAAFAHAAASIEACARVACSRSRA